MKLNYSSNVFVNKQKLATSCPKPAFQGKIVHFTGKPTSKEVSEVVEVAGKVSKQNILKMLDELAGPKTEGRGVGQKGIEIARDYIAEKYKQFGLEPVKALGLTNYYEDFKLPQYPVTAMRKGPYIYGQLNRYGFNKEVTGTNVLGMIKGYEKPDEYIVISGHYDHLGKDERRNIIFPGANDDASGVVTLMEIARIMSEGPPPKKSVIFAALTGEESGWLGANNLSKDLVKKGLAQKVEVLNIEMLAAVAGNKMEIWDQKMPEIQNVVSNISKAGNELGVKTVVHHDIDPGSDAIRFSTYGIPAASIVWDFDMKKNHPTYHCAEDTPESINKNIFYEAARVAAAASYLSANDTRPVPLPTMNMMMAENLHQERVEALKNKKPL